MGRNLQHQRKNNVERWLSGVKVYLLIILLTITSSLDGLFDGWMGGWIYRWMDTQINQSINQNVYSAPSRSLLRGAPDPGQAEKKSLEKVVELRTGTIREMPYWKSIPGCWTNHRKRTCLHCRRAGDWDHQITLDKGHCSVRRYAQKERGLQSSRR